jgi:hypothetical protein
LEAVVNGDAALAQVKAFIAAHIQSVVQLEVLLLLYDHAQENWTAARVAQALRVDKTWVEAQLANLAASGFLSRKNGRAPTYRYAPRAPELHEDVRRLVWTYAERRVTVINMIYSKTPDHLRAFTEAFKLKQRKEDE